VANLVCVLLGGGVEIHMFEIICDDSAEILSQASLYFFNVPLQVVQINALSLLNSKEDCMECPGHVAEIKKFRMAISLIQFNFCFTERYKITTN